MCRPHPMSPLNHAGECTWLMSRRCRYIVGVDKSEVTIEAARKRYPGLRFGKLPAATIPTVLHLHSWLASHFTGTVLACPRVHLTEAVDGFDVAALKVCAAAIERELSRSNLVSVPSACARVRYWHGRPWRMPGRPRHRPRILAPAPCKLHPCIGSSTHPGARAARGLRRRAGGHRGHCIAAHCGGAGGAVLQGTADWAVA